ncbi:hypothetical protein [Flammeovirga kamogawensis]|uniref:DUF4249 family protein n=1 Tax=Flammeovirga kamogawensis TaxID=373891 RepID=A0ABX8GTY5_9BACT|nr:hypothetical protein [Flammeovirga kamogawensis]MBB6460087.1 hypothetical protein [Flammeovirga kamogawensis]QWG06869.1 hypothetical protein KM029_16400 [Flammeovirga kamogawensis]TRX68691.1 hypothetical protein EO216_11395 [Flammeovirga kamogawensis]
MTKLLSRKLAFIFFVITFSCGLIEDSSDTPDTGLDPIAFPASIHFEYNLYTPQNEDIKDMLLYFTESGNFSVISQTFQNDSTVQAFFNYNDNNRISSIEFTSIDLQVVLKTYTFNYDKPEENSYSISVDGNIVLRVINQQSTDQLYSVINYVTSKTHIYTYEKGTITTEKIFNSLVVIDGQKPDSEINFIYNPNSYSIFISSSIRTEMLLAQQFQDIHFTPYFSTSPNSANLLTQIASVVEENTRIEYRTIYNDDLFPTSISMISSQSDMPTKQIIHTISYAEPTPF